MLQEPDRRSIKFEENHKIIQGYQSPNFKTSVTLTEANKSRYQKFLENIKTLTLKSKISLKQ